MPRITQRGAGTGEHRFPASGSAWLRRFVAWHQRIVKPWTDGEIAAVLLDMDEMGGNGAAGDFTVFDQVAPRLVSPHADVTMATALALGAPLNVPLAYSLSLAGAKLAALVRGRW